jgi:hypothetical protein
MSNEQYLILSYFFVGTLAILIALAIYAYLRNPLTGLITNRNLAAVFKRLFPAGLVLPALAGFLSVSYHGCTKNYAQIIADRSYLVAKNQEQISTVCFYLLLAILGWDVAVLLGLIIRAKEPMRDADKGPVHQ